MFKKKDIVEYFNRNLNIIGRVDDYYTGIRPIGIQYVWVSDNGWTSSNILKLISRKIGSINILVIREDNDN
jgi:hypothetical protein